MKKSTLLNSDADLKKAAKALKKLDPLIAQVISKLPSPTYVRNKKDTPYNVLFSAIVHQQLNGVAAKTILQRVKDLDGGKKIPSPESFLKLSAPKLRKAGLSGNKTKALKDLAKKTLAGEVPTLKQMEKMSEIEIIEKLVAIHGIGPWTVDMLLIFFLGRADILPVGDYAVRVAVGRIHGMKETPTPKQVHELGKKWSPHRSVASIYLWRSLDAPKNKKDT